MRGQRSGVPVSPVAHLRFGHDGAARRGEPHALGSNSAVDPKGGVALPGRFLGNSSTTQAINQAQTTPSIGLSWSER